MEYVEDYESRLQKTATSLVERDKETQDSCELKMPKALPWYISGNARKK